jgi:predicted transcriptional regulator
MSLDEFYKMIDQAKQDSENGRVIPHQDLKEKIKSWK